MTVDWYEPDHYFRFNPWWQPLRNYWKNLSKKLIIWNFIVLLVLHLGPEWYVFHILKEGLLMTSLLLFHVFLSKMANAIDYALIKKCMAAGWKTTFYSLTVLVQKYFNHAKIHVTFISLPDVIHILCTIYTRYTICR